MNDRNLTMLFNALKAKQAIFINGEPMKILSVKPRKGITTPNETIVKVDVKSIRNETRMVLTGSPGFVVDIINQ